MYTAKFVTILLLSVFFTDITAQTCISLYTDAGADNSSDEMFIRTAGSGSYQYGRNRIEGSILFELKGAGPGIFSGTLIEMSRQHSIKEFSFDTEALFLYSRFSELVNEYDWGVRIKKQFEHFTCDLGVSFRTYFITRQARDEYDICSDSKLHENWNIIYSAKYLLKPPDHKWNAGVTVTNVDHFIINQETNPVFNINARYNITSMFTVFSEAWYKSSGAFNLSVNYFGFFIRTGIIWKINI